MRCRVILLLILLSLASTAAAAEITLTAGSYLFAGKAPVLHVTAVTRAASASRPTGILLPNGDVLRAPNESGNAIRLGRPLTIRGRVFTPATVAPWVASMRVQAAAPPVRPDELPPFPHKLAIITDNYFLGMLTMLDAYIAEKQAQGWEVMVVGSDTWNPTNLIGQPAADVLRAWLAANYETEGIGFVLLMGNPDPNYGSVPMKMVWPLKDVCDKTQDPVFCDMQNLPTDFYYSDLDGNWDLNGNGLAGEYPGDAGDGGYDFGPEVIVGRFPAHYDPNFLDAYLYLASAYDSATDLHGRNRVLLPGAMVGFNGLSPGMENQDSGATLNVIGNHLADLDDKLVFTRMFEEEGFFKSTLPNDYALSYEHLVNSFRYGHGLTIWFAHGYPTYTERMIWEDDADGNGVCEYTEYNHKTMLDSFGTDAFFDAATQTFLWQISCLNGYPELEYNLGAMMLYTNSVGSICATRSAFGEYTPGDTWKPDPATGASETLAYYWAEQMTTGATVGEALAYVKATIPLDGWDDVYPPSMYGYSLMGMGLQTKWNYNLYGDPTLVWTYEAGAQDPDWPWPDVDDDTVDDDTIDDDTTADDDATDDDASPQAGGGDNGNGCGC